MASSQKKKVAAKAVPARVKSAPAEVLVAPRAVSVTRGARPMRRKQVRKPARTLSPRRPRRFNRASAARSRRAWSSPRGFHQGQDRGG